MKVYFCFITLHTWHMKGGTRGSRHTCGDHIAVRLGKCWSRLLLSLAIIYVECMCLEANSVAAVQGVNCPSKCVQYLLRKLSLLYLQEAQTISLFLSSGH